MPHSAWFSDDERKPFPTLDRELTVDVAVVGGGITGATTAYLLKQAGLKVAVVDRYRCGESETGHTTAHLTCVTDKRLHELADQWGADAAQAAWDAGTAAVDQIEHIAEQERIDCDFVRIPGYLHASWDAEDDRDGPERDGLERDAELAAEFGYSSTTLEAVPLANRFGIRFDRQALFHPLKYLAGLTRRIDGDGSFVFESTNVDEIDEHQTLHCRGGKIYCDRVVLATHVPLQGKSGTLPAILLQSRLAQYNTYAVAARLEQPVASPGSWWDTSDPYYYLRLENRGDFQTAIFGGEDHKTGQCDDTSKPYAALVERLHKILPTAVVTDRWSGQVIETNDGLPLIGETDERQYIATGYAGNGMTFGTCAGMIIRDLIVGHANPWSDLFDPHRVHLHGGTWRYVRENSDYPKYYLRDRLAAAQGDSLADVPPGTGRIIKLDGKKVAAYRDPHGNVTCVSPICTHMGCLVHWNRAERTWDCPCHGARYTPEGKVIGGPAERALEPHQEEVTK